MLNYLEPLQQWRTPSLGSIGNGESREQGRGQPLVVMSDDMILVVAQSGPVLQINHSIDPFLSTVAQNI